MNRRSFFRRAGRLGVGLGAAAIVGAALDEDPVSEDAVAGPSAEVWQERLTRQYPTSWWGYSNSTNATMTTSWPVTDDNFYYLYGDSVPKVQTGRLT